jgi:hypothetical protein
MPRVQESFLVLSGASGKDFALLLEVGYFMLQSTLHELPGREHQLTHKQDEGRKLQV